LNDTEHLQLIDEMIAGDEKAFEKVVRLYGDQLLGYLTKMTGCRATAEDRFQETFKRLYEKKHTFKGGNFKSWLFRIATNIVMDGFRKQKNVVQIPIGIADCDGTRKENFDIPDVSNDPASQVEKAEQAKLVRSVIAKLPKRQKATLVMSYYQKLTYREVAEVLDCSIGTVKTQMFRALRTLADNLPELRE